MDPYGNDEQAAQLAAAMAGLPYRQQALQSKLRRGQMLFQTPQPQGAQVGRTYVASSPLEHLAAAMSRVIGGRQMQAAEDEFGPLAQQAEQAGLAQATQARADKRFSQGLQIRGLERQEAADARTAAHQDATLGLQQQEAARRAAADAEEAKYRAGMLGVQREGLGLKRQEIDAAKDAKDAAGKEAKAAAALKGADDLRKEFQGTPAYKDMQSVDSSYRKIAGASPTGAGDIALIFNFMKMLDPGSTVREGEFAQAASTGAVPDRVLYFYRKLDGDKLPPSAREQLRSEAERVFRAQQDQFESVAGKFRGYAEVRGYDPNHVVFRDPPAAAQRTVVRTGTNTKTGRKVVQYSDGTIEEQ